MEAPSPPVASQFVWAPLPDGLWMPALLLGSADELADRFPSPLWNLRTPDSAIILPVIPAQPRLALVKLASVRAPFIRFLPELGDGLVCGRAATPAQVQMVREAVHIVTPLAHMQRKDAETYKRKRTAAAPPATTSAQPLPPAQHSTLSSPLVPAKQPVYAAHISTKILRIWDFLHNFRDDIDLNFTRDMGLQRDPLLPFETPTPGSLVAAVSDPESSLYAHIMCTLVNFIAKNVVDLQRPRPRWLFSNGNVRQSLAMPCTPMTYRCLLDELVNIGAFVYPENAVNSNVDVLDAVVQTVLELPSMRVLIMTRACMVIEPGSPPEYDDSTKVETELPAPETPEQEARRSTALERLISSTDDLVALEEAFDHAASEGLQGYDDEGNVIWRSVEMRNALEQMEKLSMKRRCAMDNLYAQCSVRTLPLGRDLSGRTLYSFISDMFDGDCVVWAHDTTLDRWYYYRGQKIVQELASDLAASEPATREALTNVILVSARRLKPATLKDVRAARNQGWRFYGDELIGGNGRFYDARLGVVDCTVAAWKKVGDQVMYKVVVDGEDWTDGKSLDRRSVLALIANSESPSGNWQLPPNSDGWVRSAEEPGVVVRLPNNGFHVYGCIVATRGEDALCLADGGKLVPLLGPATVREATRAFSNPCAPTRRRPLTHRAGPVVGLPGLTEMLLRHCHVHFRCEVLAPFKMTILFVEEQYHKNVPDLWASEGTLARQHWRTFVENATSESQLALALLCMLDHLQTLSQQALDLGARVSTVSPTSMFPTAILEEAPTRPSAVVAKSTAAGKRAKEDSAPTKRVSGGRGKDTSPRAKMPRVQVPNDEVEHQPEEGTAASGADAEGTPAETAPEVKPAAKPKRESPTKRGGARAKADSSVSPVQSPAQYPPPPPPPLSFEELPESSNTAQAEGDVAAPLPPLEGSDAAAAAAAMAADDDGAAPDPSIQMGSEATEVMPEVAAVPAPPPPPPPHPAQPQMQAKSSPKASPRASARAQRVAASDSPLGTRRSARNKSNSPALSSLPEMSVVAGSSMDVEARRSVEQSPRSEQLASPPVLPPVLALEEQVVAESEPAIVPEAVVAEVVATEAVLGVITASLPLAALATTDQEELQSVLPPPPGEEASASVAEADRMPSVQVPRAPEPSVVEVAEAHVLRSGLLQVVEEPPQAPKVNAAPEQIEKALYPAVATTDVTAGLETSAESRLPVKGDEELQSI